MSDNINTFDKDGELRLTIMASLAQDESRKTSERVKHGQKKSMENGVVYGTGNILGYDRVGGKLVVNEEQANIVKLIYKMYLEGKGARAIKFELERVGHKNSQGGVEWWHTTILRILQNPFYCGRVVMRKQIVTDFLEQKRIRNNGIVEKIIRKGNHEPLVPEDDFDRVQEILKSRTQNVDMTNIRGKRDNKYLWSGKIFCGNCGSVYKRTNWHKLKDGTRIYAYWCSLRAKNGTTQNRNAYNAPMENVCDSVAIPEWKFDNMAKFVIAKMWENRGETLQALEESIQTFAVDVDYSVDVLAIKKGIDKYEKKIKNLIDMRSDGEITKEEFLAKRKEFDDYINNQNSIMKTFDKRLEQAANKEMRIEKIKDFLKHELDFSQPKLPDEIVDLIIRKVVVYSNKKFKLYIINEGEVDIDLDEIKNPPQVVHGSTGSS